MAMQWAKTSSIRAYKETPLTMLSPDSHVSFKLLIIHRNICCGNWPQRKLSLQHETGYYCGQETEFARARSLRGFTSEGDAPKDKVGGDDGTACMPEVWLNPPLLSRKAEWLAKEVQGRDVRYQAAHCILGVEDCSAGEDYP